MDKYNEMKGIVWTDEPAAKVRQVDYDSPIPKDHNESKILERFECELVQEIYKLGESISMLDSKLDMILRYGESIPVEAEKEPEPKCMVDALFNYVNRLRIHNRRLSDSINHLNKLV